MNIATTVVSLLIGDVFLQQYIYFNGYLVIINQSLNQSISFCLIKCEY